MSKVRSVLLFALFFCPVLRACQIPSGWFITSPDPCRVVDDIRAIWPEVEARRWFAAWSQKKPFEPLGIESIESMPFLFITEHPGAFGLNKNLAGTFNPVGFPTIEFTRAYPEYHALQHELTHLAYWKVNPSGNEFMNIGHGTADDEFTLAINAWVNRLWAVTPAHSYFPGFLPIIKASAEPTCRVIRGQQ